jgi:hypothetical protein
MRANQRVVGAAIAVLAAAGVLIFLGDPWYEFQLSGQGTEDFFEPVEATAWQMWGLIDVVIAILAAGSALAAVIGGSRDDPGWFKVGCGMALGAAALIVFAMIDTPERGDPSGPSIEQAGITDTVTLQYGIWLALVSAVVGAVACALSARDTREVKGS